MKEVERLENINHRLYDDVEDRKIKFEEMENSYKRKFEDFKNEIEAFKKNDSIVPPPTNAILFVGSSSFNYWKDIINYFPGYPIINRGFGGSTLLDVQYYIKETILKYRPKKIFIY